MYGVGGPTSGTYRSLSNQPSAPLRDHEVDAFDFGAYCRYVPNFCGQWGDKPQFVGGYGLQCDVGRTAWFAVAFGETMPREDNRLTLDQKKKDRWGIPALHISIRHDENERRMVEHIKQSLHEFCEACDLTPVTGGGRFAGVLSQIAFRALGRAIFQSDGSFHPGAAIHEVGGARMGKSPKGSVVNEFCQTWDVPNLFVTDGACFVSPGYQNHTLTIMALTARACDYILREYKKEIY
jgi:choline dehydrogenase-like flavoprotein